jgi:hypothetical protein
MMSVHVEFFQHNFSNTVFWTSWHDYRFRTILVAVEQTNEPESLQSWAQNPAIPDENNDRVLMHP